MAMDPLFGEAKKMYPNASDDEISQGLAQIRQQGPDLSDEQILQAAQKIQAAQADGSWQKQMVQENLKQKYNLGQYSPEARQKLVDANASAASPWLAGLAGFGAGIRGGDVNQGFNTAMGASQAKTKAALDAFDKNRQQMQQDYDFERGQKEDERKDKDFEQENDVNSEISNSYDAILRKMGYKGPKVSAAKAKQMSPVLEKMYQLDENKKDKALDRALKQQELDLKKQTAGNKITEGQKSVDKDYAKDYNEWTAGGAKTARNEIDKLQGVVNDMKAGKISTGRENRLIPDFLASNDRIKARHDVESSVMASLRATLGAQFTENEGKRIIANTWDENDTEENNIARLERLVDNLKSKADDNDKKAKFYESKGSLAGYQTGSAPTKEAAPQGQKIKVSNGKETLMIDPADEADAAKDGYKRVQ